MFIATASSRLLLGLWGSVVNTGTLLGVVAWDLGLTIYNTFARDRPVGGVIAQGEPGHAGLWPQFIPPTDKDSRSCCPALNALSNHGILPRDGRNITYPELSAAVHKVFNFAPSFCFFVPNYYAGLLSRSYSRDTISLSDFNVHNGIEHDASLARHDVVFQNDQSKPAIDLIDDLLRSATGPNGTLTASDMSAVLSRRRRQAKFSNSQFSLSTFHKLFGSFNSATLLTIFGGIVEDLEIFLKEERLPDGWEPKIRHPGGLTMSTFNKTGLRVELGIDESPDVDDKKHQ